MDNISSPFFRPEDLAKAALLKEKGGIGPLFFSEGTYQVEITDKRSYWPLLQLSDEGAILDGFCTCSTAEAKNSCPHLAAAYIEIFAGTSLPIHVRFRDSLWNCLGQLAMARHGAQRELFEETKTGWKISSATGKELFFITISDRNARQHLQELLVHRQSDAETLSLKLSHLSADELLKWQEGNPSPDVAYSLSFWADLAKWWMQLQDHAPYELTFSDEIPPKWIYFSTPILSMGMYISEASWPSIIPTLSTIQSTLPLLEEPVLSILYDPQNKLFQLDLPQAPMSIPDSHVRLGEWLLIPSKGFVPAHTDPLFTHKTVPQDKIDLFLQRHAPLVKKHLKNTTIHLLPITPRYHLFFDAERNLHIDAYLFEPGDLSEVFGTWVFLKNKGFYALKNPIFETASTSIAHAEIGHFINSHRILLNGIPGFQVHISTISSSCTFSVSKTEGLAFSSRLPWQDADDEIIDCNGWIYLKGKGFFQKETIHPAFTGKIPPSDISSFIDLHRHELDGIPGFFTFRCPIERSGLHIFLNETGRITIQPHIEFAPGYDPSNVLIFSEYTYVAKEGFAEIPFEKRLPPEYLEAKEITPADEPHFIAYELATLQPHILSLADPLSHPNNLSLHLSQMKSWRDKQWLAELHYTSEHGSIELYPIWEALHARKKYLFTPAGLILLNQTRFNWLKNIPKKCWSQQGKVLKITTMDWLRLSILDDVQIRDVSLETRHHIESLASMQTDLPLDLSLLKSTLRSYQEMGVKWLWFLFNHALSGLLCDEMGLGKTHQAMGLIAAIPPTCQTLIVCPTSVVYHWEALIQQFLPSMRLSVFYGTRRTLETFTPDTQLLLTSYGTLRSERKALSRFQFDLAIFDEVQIAKNAHSQTHKALKLINATMRLGLSGTPIENRLLELKALFDLIVPHYLPNDALFKDWFINPIEKNHDLSRKELLSRFIRPFILRRKKTEVLQELPEKIEEIAYCDLSDEQAALYHSVYAERKQALLSQLENPDTPIPYLHIFSLISTLKQICDHPCLITKQFDHFERHASGKWDLFTALLQQVRESGQKLVVFSQYLDMLTLIERYLTEQKIGFSAIRGSTRDRKAQLDAFRDDPNKEVFVASLQAVGVGVDLVSASVVIHYDRWWNPAKENQATDRVHRIGQNRGVQVFKLVTKGTIEEQIHQLIEKKKGLAESVLGFDDQDQIKKINRQELIQLFKELETNS